MDYHSLVITSKEAAPFVQVDESEAKVEAGPEFNLPFFVVPNVLRLISQKMVVGGGIVAILSAEGTPTTTMPFALLLLLLLLPLQQHWSSMYVCRWIECL